MQWCCLYRLQSLWPRVDHVRSIHLRPHQWGNDWNHKHIKVLTNNVPSKLPKAISIEPIQPTMDRLSEDRFESRSWSTLSNHARSQAKLLLLESKRYGEVFPEWWSFQLPSLMIARVCDISSVNILPMEIQRSIHPQGWKPEGLIKPSGILLWD